jgi:YidC/Oxa1 family membrane protein insertase
MDKRTLLALGLSFLVFLVWSLVYSPKPTDKPIDKQSMPEKDQRQPFLKERAMPSAPKRDFVLEVGRDSEDIRIETELYTAIFSGSGPAIKSFKLKKYLSKLEKDSPLRELIHIKNKDGYGFNLGFSGQNIPGYL